MMLKEGASMVEAAIRLHPLEGRVYGGNGVALSPLENRERISLRAETKSVAALGKAIGLTLPKKPGATITKNGVTAMWIGPDEWFIMGVEGAGLEEKLNTVKTGLYSVVSINHRNTGMMISGHNAVNAINGGCPRDLSLEAFPVNTCSRTIIGKAEVILFRTGAEEFHVECWRSFSDYVWKFLAEAARSA